LSEEHRTVLTRYAFGDVRYRELARELGISDGTVMSRLFHARRKVREALEAKGVI
jgi:RNA polymerase sigma-70 factor (ECF subfamily)